MRRPSHPSEWKAIVGRPTLPPSLQGLASRPLYSAEQSSALPHTILLILSPLMLGLGWLLAGLAIPDLVIAAPSLMPISALVAMIGLGLWWAAERDFVPRLCGWLARIGWIAVAAAALVYAVVAISSHRAAVAGPVMRAQVVHFESRGSRNLRATVVIALQDGSAVAVETTAGGLSGRRCYAVRRLIGPRGFSWLRIVAASPGPGPGQLEWPIDRANCFSNADLATLGR